MIQSVLPQLTFSFYRHQPIRADFSGGRITSDAGLLPLRAFDQRHHLTQDWAEGLSDPSQKERVQHGAPVLLRQCLYQIVAGYEDVNDADRLRHDPLLQVVADQKFGVALGSQPTLSRWENAPSARDLVRWNDRLCEHFIRLCGDQVRQRGEILLDLDSTDDPTHGQQQLSFFNGAYGQHMYHSMLVFERHTGCMLAARLRPGNASSDACTVPMLLRLVPRLQAAFPGVKIKLRGDAGFALPLLYQFCEFFTPRACPRHPRQLRLQASCGAAAEAVGKFDESELLVFMYELKADLNAYLARLGPRAPMRTLQDIIDFNDRNRQKEMPYFGQDLFVKAQAKGPLTEKAYVDALAKNHQLARTEGIDALMDKHHLDAIVAPTGGPAWLTDLVNGDHVAGGSSNAAAVAGYPNINVTAGSLSGLPVGISFFGRAWSEPTLIKLAYSFEQATKARQAPRFLPTIAP